MYMAMHGHMVYVCACVYVHTHRCGGLRSASGIILQNIIPLFFETESLIGMKYTQQARLLASRTQGSACLLFLRIAAVCHGAQPFNVGGVSMAHTLYTKPSPMPGCT